MTVGSVSWFLVKKFPGFPAFMSSNKWEFFRRNREQFGTKTVEVSKWCYFQLDNIRRELEEHTGRDLEIGEVISLLLEHEVFESG